MTRRVIFALAALFLWQASAFQNPGTHPVTGRKIAGVMGSDDAWTAQVQEAAGRAGERVNRSPRRSEAQKAGNGPIPGRAMVLA